MEAHLLTPQQTVEAFVADCCELSPDGWVPKRELNDAYRHWCQKERCQPISHLKFHSIVAVHTGAGSVVKQKNGGTWICFMGIKLKDQQNQR